MNAINIRFLLIAFFSSEFRDSWTLFAYIHRSKPDVKSCPVRDMQMIIYGPTRFFMLTNAIRLAEITSLINSRTKSVSTRVTR
jgi:hypothetical protein